MVRDVAGTSRRVARCHGGGLARRLPKQLGFPPPRQPSVSGAVGLQDVGSYSDGESDFRSVWRSLGATNRRAAARQPTLAASVRVHHVQRAFARVTIGDALEGDLLPVGRPSEIAVERSAGQSPLANAVRVHQGDLAWWVNETFGAAQEDDLLPVWRPAAQVVVERVARQPTTVAAGSVNGVDLLALVSLLHLE